MFFCLLKDGSARHDLTGRGEIRQKDAQIACIHYSIHKISAVDKHLPIFSSGEKKANYQGQFRLLCECKIYIQTAGRGRSVILGRY